MKNTPLSPFFIYKWRYTFLNFSILGRVAGLVIAIGIFPFVYLLYSLASGPEEYSKAARVLSHPAGRLLAILLLWSFSFHALNGIRHLVRDAGHGFEKTFNRVSTWLVACGSLAVTVIIYALFNWRFG